MVKILQPRRVTYTTVSLLPVVTTLLSSVTIATCFLKALQKSLRGHYIDLVVSIVICTFVIYLVGCVSFSSLYGAPIRSYFVEAEDRVTTLQSVYGVCAVELCICILHLFIVGNHKQRQ